MLIFVNIFSQYRFGFWYINYFICNNKRIYYESGAN
jgi:hypothetical protein